MKLRRALLICSLCVGAGYTSAQTPVDNRQAAPAEQTLDAPAPNGIRPGGTLAQEFKTPAIPAEVKSMPRPTRNYPEQPPVVPHNIRDYQIDKNFNRCLTCHSRNATELSGAPMVSVTHYRDRDGQVLAAVSPRRYFCLQCHVPQHDIAPIKASTFKGIDQVLNEVIIERQGKRDAQGSALKSRDQ